MSAEMIATLRVAQLFLVSLLGFGSIWLGYRLFSQIPITTTAGGDFKMPQFGAVKLKAGPGVFFALFGAVAIYYSVARTTEISRSSGDPVTTASSPGCEPSSCIITIQFQCVSACNFDPLSRGIGVQN